jgi:MoxR-like ATPase
MNGIEKLNAVLAHVKAIFVGKNEIIDVLGIALVARENAFLLGPPGTAKSAIVRALSDSIQGGSNFEYLLTRFTEPNEIFGPFDIRKLREGELVTNTEGMMPEASMIFLDEIFNANSAILNSLLMALNEKIFRRGKETRKLPALMFIGASNTLPEDEALNALLDRFLIRVECDYVAPDRLNEVLLAGWNLENGVRERPEITADEIRDLQLLSKKTDLSDIRKQYVEAIHNLRNTGIKVSDRRAVKIQNLIAASALMCNRDKAILSDLWVLKYVWDTEEQIELLAGIVDAIIQKDNSAKKHPLASFNQAPDAEDLIREVHALRNQWDSGEVGLEERSLIKDKLRYVQTRSNWIKKPEHQQHIQQQIDSLWQAILQAV